MNTRRYKVHGVHALESGVELDLHDLQISASDNTGTINLVDLELLRGTSKVSDDINIKPGHWLVQGRSMVPVIPAKTLYFETDTYTRLTSHMQAFLSKVEVYRNLNLTPKRSILLGSDPGVGKTSLINHFCNEVQEKYPGEVAILRIASEDSNWHLLQNAYTHSPDLDKVKLSILIIEDIGGTALSERADNVDASLLNFLDGNSTFGNVPTLIIGTTNYLNDLSNTLTDRPGRFDVVLHVSPPGKVETRQIAESILNRPLTPVEEVELTSNEFTPAYIKECVVRHLIYDITLEQAVQDLKAQRKLSRDRRHGSNRRDVGIN